ncbi:MAPEG family protein [Marinomonas posidonica]|uniref:Membrane-associated protein in eicosanoid and glutathione metabolism (MAPEG) n=1 Tax=Marinomonas posidonica (strain CECT 7376 / NCIMB 14433 / IVIA-Po-181) TaxID=491952 RepID=F6CV99_MARPP|nr:MAPEG family protein [Marinomonas posidonica]AEF54209.1 hypothetical protein Mar181_1161 [Marinomonas posidonica IVIA-Po-181]
MPITIHITSLYAAFFGLLLLPITIRVGLRRIATNIWFLDGGDDNLLRRIRSHANFLEYVPFAIVLMALAELNAAPNAFMHTMGLLLISSRLMHYITINTKPLAPTRALSMLGTFGVFLMASCWLLYAQMPSIFQSY